MSRVEVSLPSFAVFSWLNSPDHEGTHDKICHLRRSFNRHNPPLGRRSRWYNLHGKIENAVDDGADLRDHTSGRNTRKLASFFLLHKPLQTAFKTLRHLGLPSAAPPTTYGWADGCCKSPALTSFYTGKSWQPLEKDVSACINPFSMSPCNLCLAL